MAIDMLVSKSAAAGVERVVKAVMLQVSYRCRVDVSKALQPSREVRRVVVSTEHAAEVRVEHVLCLLPVRERIRSCLAMCRAGAGG